MQRFVAALIASLVLVAHVEVAYAAGSFIVLDKKEYVYVPSDVECKERGICDLKKVTFFVEQSRLPPIPSEFKRDSDLFQTMFMASYETARVSDLEKYAFVQFIRGCSYISSVNEAGETKEEFGISTIRWVDGAPKRVTYLFPEWTIDATEADPVYSSMPSLLDSRHFVYMWQNTKGKLDPYANPDEEGVPQKVFYYGQRKPLYPQIPRLYIQDQPSASALQHDGKARNYSLQFRTCLYKTKEVPELADPKNTGFADPVVCFNWDHNFVFNHKAKTFEARKEISPICTKPPSPDDHVIENVVRGEK